MATAFRIYAPKPQRKRTGREKRGLTRKVSDAIGSWQFIGGQAGLLSLWILLNTFTPIKWDAPPYILLNLMLSFQAAFTGPVLLMAANKQAEVDRQRDIDHYMIDVHDSHVLEVMAKQLEHIHKHVEHDDCECHF